MCDINCIWLFNLLVAFVLIIQQQQHVVVGIKLQRRQQQHHKSPYDDITSYASVLATKYLHQHSLPKANVVKREIKNDKSTDFISYLSDFNMQDEASIPEDIFDQRHLREIEEKERSSGAGGFTSAGGAGGDVIDVNLPYDDSDADAEADIILESQRSSERNFSSNDENNKNNANMGYEDGTGAGVVYMAEVRPANDDDADAGFNGGDNNLKKTNNKKEIFKERKKINYGAGNDKKHQGYEPQLQLQPQPQQHQGQNGIKYENNIESSAPFTYDVQEQDFSKDPMEEDNYEDGMDDEDDEDDDDGSAEYERFKCMHEKKQREQQQQQQQQKEREELQKKQRQQQQMLRRQQQKEQLPPIKKLNERKFNKPSLSEHEKMVLADEEDHAEDDDDHHDDGDSDADDDDDDDDNKPDNKKNLDDNDSDNADDGKYHQLQDHHQQQQQQQTQPEKQQQQQQQQDAIGDITDEENDENPNAFKANHVENKDFTNMFIPRKMKRHNGAARLDDATNRYTRIKQQQQQQQQHRPSAPNSNEDNPKDKADDDDDGDGVDNQEEYMSHFRAKETNIQKAYYGLVNGNASQTEQPEQHHQQQYGINPKGDNNGGDNGQKASEQQHVLINDSSKETAAAATATEATTTTTTAIAAHEGIRRQSLFEREKSLRRNNKRYGHKTHKKKYKDYLHYSSVMMMRLPATTTLVPETAAATATPEQSTTAATTKLIQMDNTKAGDENNLRFHKEKYDRKLKLEKSKGMAGLPPSPIFLLKSRDSHQPTPKPFYEGQINYYLETDDDDGGGRVNEARFITKGDRMDTNDWYRKLSPVLRNGVKSTANHNNQEDRVGGVGKQPVVGGSAGGGSGGAAWYGGLGGYTPNHHYRNHHQRHHHHGVHQKHHHHHSRNHAYQRKMIPKKLLVTTTPMPPPSRKHTEDSSSSSSSSSASSIRELGHQITDLKEFERYYAKWPHLARVQSQLHDEQLREQLELQNLQQQQLGNYQDYEYDEDYFEALQGGSSGGDNAEENLPPYIRKYNRRNKQLLDLLEGTMPPPTRPPQQQQLRWAGSKLQPGPRDSSVGSMSVRIDDDYLKEKRKRYHQRQRQIHDLFEQQRATTTTTTAAPTPYPYANTNKDNQGNDNNHEPDSRPEHGNHFPDEDVSISLETQEHEDTAHEQKIWQKEIGSKSSSAAALATSSLLSPSSNTGNSPIRWHVEKLITPSPMTGQVGSGGSSASAQAPVAATPKSAIFKLPSYPSIAGSFMQRPRSRSAQFAPSSGSEYRRVTPGQYAPNSNSNFINAGGFVAYNGHNTGANAKSMSARFSANDVQQHHTTALPPPSVLATTNSSKNNKNQAASSSSTSSATRSLSSSSPASVSNSFVYHRVVDASPRLVGAGLTGRKQRLPFVAITDRRLETSKKSLTDHQKDFEQNHYPLP